MKKSNWVIAVLAIAVLVLSVCYINARDTMKFNQARDELQILNYEATDFCLRLAMAFCNQPEMQTILGEGTDMEHPSFFEGSRSILGIYQMKTVHDLDAPPLVTYYIYYLVLETGDAEHIQSSHLVLQTVILTKDNNPNGSAGWKYEILNYSEV